MRRICAQAFSRPMIVWVAATLLGVSLSYAETAPSAETKAPALRDPALRDGKLFDPGTRMDAPAPTAPAELARWTPFLGVWNFDYEVHRPGQPIARAEGVSSITFMNRGHAVMERTRIADFEGHPIAGMEFIAVDGNGVWTVGEGNSWSEAVTVWSGGFDGDTLVLHDAMRPGGGATLMLMRRTYRATKPSKTAEAEPTPTRLERFELTVEVSTDVGKTWSLRAKRSYTRAAEATPFPVRDDVGVPDPERAPEADQFDFLIGHFDATHWLKRPDRELRWTADATAVHVLDGHGILEFNWNDKDPSLPDAATSILRVYNRAMRRWESLYLTNRGNVPLHFGGVKEVDRIVLHPFDAQTSGNPLSQWIFYNMQADTYQWKGLRSADRSVAAEPTWTIDFKRRAPDDGSAKK